MQGSAAEKQSIVSGATQGNQVKTKAENIGSFCFVCFVSSTTCADLCSNNSSVIRCLHLQIGCSNQQPSHSGALILQRLSIVVLPSAARGCLGLEQLIGSDVLSFPLKLIRRRRVAPFFLFQITCSVVL